MVKKKKFQTRKMLQKDENVLSYNRILKNMKFFFNYLLVTFAEYINKQIIFYPDVIIK